MATSLAAAFGMPTNAKDVRQLIANFDFSKLKDSTSTSDESLNIALAPSFGTLNSESVKLMDDKLKVIIAGTVRALGKLTDKSWETVVATLAQNPLLEPLEETTQRADKYTREGTNWFKFDGGADAPIVKEVQTWFHNLIADEDVLNSTGIDINILADIVASTGARVVSAESVVFKQEQREHNVLEIGVLRFPDIEHPFIKVYRIKLTAWSDCTRVAIVQTDKNGITGTFTSRKYKPRDSIIADLKQDVRAKAVSEAESMFDD
ncbi:unnamed protein product [Ectocarpus fasciculatus]